MSGMKLLRDCIVGPGLYKLTNKGGGMVTNQKVLKRARGTDVTSAVEIKTDMKMNSTDSRIYNRISYCRNQRKDPKMCKIAEEIYRHKFNKFQNNEVMLLFKLSYDYFCLTTALIE